MKTSEALEALRWRCEQAWDPLWLKTSMVGLLATICVGHPDTYDRARFELLVASKEPNLSDWEMREGVVLSDVLPCIDKACAEARRQEDREAIVAEIKGEG